MLHPFLLYFKLEYAHIESMYNTLLRKYVEFLQQFLFLKTFIPC